MANNPVVNTLTFTGNVAGQATIQAQGIAGGLTFLLPNTVPVQGQLIDVVSVNGTNVFLGWVSPQSTSITLSQILPSGATSGQTIVFNGTNWVPSTGLPGEGTVTSVAVAVPAWLAVSGSPITSAGTITISSAPALTANWVLATPNGTTGVLAPRALVAADIPVLPAYVPHVSSTGTSIADTSSGSGLGILINEHGTGDSVSGAGIHILQDTVDTNIQIENTGGGDMHLIVSGGGYFDITSSQTVGITATTSLTLTAPQGQSVLTNAPTTGDNSSAIATTSFVKSQGYITAAAGSSGQLQWNNAGAFAGVSGSSVDSFGTVNITPSAGSGNPALTVQQNDGVHPVADFLISGGARGLRIDHDGQLYSPQQVNLSGLLSAANTSISGTLADHVSSVGSLGQVLSSTTTGVVWTSSPRATSVTSTDLNTNLTLGTTTNGITLNGQNATVGIGGSPNAGQVQLFPAAGQNIVIHNTSSGPTSVDMTAVGNHLLGNVDMAGTVTITAGTSQAVTFNTTYGSTPKAVILTPLSDPTASGGHWVTSLSTTGFTANVTNSSTISFYYVVIG